MGRGANSSTVTSAPWARAAAANSSPMNPAPTDDDRARAWQGGVQRFGVGQGLQPVDAGQPGALAGQAAVAPTRWPGPGGRSRAGGPSDSPRACCPRPRHGGHAVAQVMPFPAKKPGPRSGRGSAALPGTR